MTEHVGRSTAIEGCPNRSGDDSAPPSDAALPPDSEEFETRLQERVDRIVEAELAEATAAMEATEGSVSPAKRQVLETLAHQLAERAVAPARQGLEADDTVVRAHTAALYDID